MCLYLDYTYHGFLVAEKDIKCYKLLIKKDGEYYSYFREEKIDFNKGQKIENFDPIESIKSNIEDYDGEESFVSSTITSGAIHSFRDFDVTKREVLSSYKISNQTIAFAECTIPKGAYYIDGYDFFMCDAYCSSELKYEKIIYEESL